MKCSHFLHALVAIVLSSCATQKGLVGNARHPETVTLTIKPEYPRPPLVPPDHRAFGMEKFGAFGALGGEVLVALGKYVVNKAGAAMEEYAKQFEAKYAAQSIQDLSNPNFTKLRGVFTRTVHFKDEATAKAACAEYGITEDHVRPTKTGFDIEALRLEFDVQPAHSGKSMRFMPTKLVYLAPKAYRLPPNMKDDPKLSFVFTVSEAVQGEDPVSHAAATEPIRIKPGMNDQHGSFATELSPSWIAMPLTGAFTVEVRALETGKGKEKIESLAKLLREWGGKAVDAAAAR